MKKGEILVFSISLIFCSALGEITARFLLNSGRLNPEIISFLSQKNYHRNPSISFNSDQKYVPNPYTLYRNNPSHLSISRNQRIKEYDSNGYRNPEYKKNSKCFKILAIGGSTTNQYPFSTRDDTWTMKLKDMLNNEALKDNCFDVYNAGLSGGTSAELLSDYLFNGIYLNPDLLIIHTGGNDGQALWQEEYKTDYSNFRSKGTIGGGFMYGLTRGGQLSKFLKKTSDISSIIKLIYYVIIKFEGGVSSYTPHMGIFFPLTYEETLAKFRVREPIAFKNNILSIVTVAKSRNTKVLIVPFIQASRKKLEKVQSFIGYEDVLITSLIKHRRALKEISNDEDINYFEFDQTVFKDSWFIDNCHLYPIGSEEKANQIFNFLKKANII